MEITEIRGAVTEGQANQLHSIFLDSFGTAPSESFLERLNEKRDLSLLLAHDEGKLIGFKIGYTRFKGVFFSWLGAVDPGRRRAGVARRLLQDQHSLCVNRGYDEIQTESSGSNRPMLILNLQEGFEVSGIHLGHEEVLTVQLRKRLNQNQGVDSNA